MVFARKEKYALNENDAGAGAGADKPVAREEAEVLDPFTALVIEEEDHEIRFRTLSWQKTTFLLFGEYVCLAILALAWSWSVLGWLCGFFITFGLGIVTWYTSYTLWQFTMRHPEAKDICDIAAVLFPGIPRIAYEATAIMLLLNNIFLIGFHVFTGARIFNTLSDSSQCTVTFQAISAIIGIIVSLPRTLKHVSIMSVVSAICMGIAILLSLIYVGIEDAPLYGYGGNYPTLGPVKTSTGLPSPQPGFVAGLNAVLNITFLWIGQILYPSFIAEMREPRDFPKALAALTIMQLILFTIAAAVGYNYMGQYATAPSIGSLSEPWARKSAFAFVLVPTVVIGAIYSNVAAKFVFKRILGNTKHAHSHSAIGWGVWIGITVGIWAVGFILGNVIPSMGDFLSIMSAAFDSFFGFIFWAVAYYHLNRGKLFRGPWKIVLTIINAIILCLGLFMLGPGLYTSIEAIIDDYAGSVRKPFSCASNSL
ncbi:transmembrane amino acid transporter protein-domain-containing protein [Naematelia encephala]|uniref:Transmembrane amino acid transporter protein-domain-containing protein n=1 Tax=Naematelia encephala TaxID=71784 RepID=A0A1Y2AQ72_9TREE|nr:transmembrane amino acid transporter protein-domain-containing protein [Naematelia encephala]